MDRYVPLPPLPERIGRLNELACDLWWSWNGRAREVFRALDYPVWRFTNHNPVLLLHLVEPERLEFAAADPGFLRVYDAAVEALDGIRSGAGTWWDQHASGKGPIAWIAPQFALHQSLPVVATSDGIIAGDLAKEASDLGVPFVGVGLMYPRAYAHQRLSAEGAQQDVLEYVDRSDAPISPVMHPDGSKFQFAVPISGSEIAVVAWQVRAGRATIYLLDTDLPENPVWVRDLSSRRTELDAEGRLRQSILLSAGAVTLFETLAITPRVWHLAGGQAAPVVLERLHRFVLGGNALAAGLAQVRATTVFNARTDAPPVHDSYEPAAVDRQLASTWPALALHRSAVLGFGQHPTDRGDAFNTAVLGARTCDGVVVNGDGVHVASWISSDLSTLFDSRLGTGWRERVADESAWLALRDAGDQEVWSMRERLRGYLVDFMRERARRRWAREQISGARVVALGTLLDDASLTIGCVPRFGDGSSADLLFEDVERLARIVTAARYPVQLVFAGRVDGADDAGRHRLQRALRHAFDPAFGGRIAFVEDYDLHVARLMVQGCDLWLTMPSVDGGRNLGAVKAAVNGVPHFGPPAASDARWTFDGARSLYRLLEEQIVPAFYERNRAGIPEAWTDIVRTTLSAAIPRYTARRAVMHAASHSSLTRV